MEQFEKFITPYIRNMKEVELNFYSKRETILFNLNISYFCDAKICLNALQDSKPAIITLIKSNVHKQIQIKPPQRVCFPEHNDLEKSIFNNFHNISSLQSKIFNDENNLTISFSSKTEKNLQESILSKNENDETKAKKSKEKTYLDYTDYVNISCNDLEYDGWHKCYHDNESKYGSFTKTPNSKASYKFTGTKVQLFTLMKNDSGIAKIKIDNFTYAADFYKETQEYGIAFTSEILEYGEHTIEIIHSGKKSHSNEGSSIIIVSLLINILPKKFGRKLGFIDLKNKVGNWQRKSNSPLFLSSDDDTASGTFEFYGNRFWLTGIKSKSKTGFKIIIDDVNTLTVNDTVTSAHVNDQEELEPTLLYQSDILDVGNHTIRIQKINSDLSLINLLYLEFPPINESVANNLDGLVNIRCCSFGTSGPTCKVDGNLGLSSDLKNVGENVWYNFYGTKVHIFGLKAANSPKIKITLDGEAYPELNLGTGNVEAKIIFSSEDLQFGHHAISVKVTALKDGNNDPFHISSIIFDPLPKVGGYKFRIDDAEIVGSWSQNSVKTPYFTSSDSSAKMTFKFFGTRFWLTGIQRASTSRPKVTFDGSVINNNHFNFSDADDSKNSFPEGNKAVLLYAYQDLALELKDHTVTIEKTEKDLSFVNFFYNTQPENSICIPVQEMKTKNNWKVEETGGYSTKNPLSLIEFSQYFTKIWVFSNKTINNAKLNVYSNNEFIKTINPDALSTTSKSDDILFSMIDIGSSSHYTIDLEHGGNSDQCLHIEYCYYINDQSILAQGDTINAESLKSLSTGEWELSSNKKYLITKTKDSTIKIEKKICKFYIKAHRHQNNGNIDIILDGKEIDSISLYRTKVIDHEVYLYESPEMCGDHTLILKNHDDRRLNITEIKYVPLPATTNLDGLINITCDRLTYTPEWRKCINESGADWGSYTSNPDQSVSYTFTGTKVHVKATKDNNAGFANIYIDDKHVHKVNLNSNGEGKTSSIVYSSDDLPFGEHTIKFERDNSGGVIFISAFIIDPLPKIGGYKLGYNDAEKEGEWEESIINTPYITSKSDAASLLFKFHGTRFWLTGIRNNSYGTFSLFIDDNSPIDCSEIIPGSYPNGANGNEAILLYESPVYELADHTVKIVKKSGNKISFVNLLYTTQPKDATYFSLRDMSLKGDWIPQKEGGYSLVDPNSAVEFSRYFTHFWVLGNKTLSQASLKFYTNDQLEDTIDINGLISATPSKEILFSKKK